LKIEISSSYQLRNSTGTGTQNIVTARLLDGKRGSIVEISEELAERVKAAVKAVHENDDPQWVGYLEVTIKAQV
jgi:hypothetical protein